MTAAGAMTFAMLIASFVLLAVALLWLRPMVARARFVSRMKEAEYSVVDAVLAGAIRRDDPAYIDYIRFNRALSEHPEWFGMTETLALFMAMRKLEIEDVSEFLPRVSYAEMKPAGRKALFEAETVTQAAIADYLVDGSRFWLPLAAARFAARHWSRAGEKVHGRGDDSAPTPGELAAQLRRAVANDEITLKSTPMFA